VIAPDATQTKYSYLDLEVRVTDAMTNTTRSQYDVWGRAAQVIPPVGPGVSYAYDVRDRLTSASRGGAVAGLAYDYAGRKIWMDDPDMGEWRYAYDALGNLRQQTDARLCVTNLSYDPLDRLTGKTYTNCPASAPVSYGYDAGTYGKGQRTSMSDGSGSTAWSYDARGQVIAETRTITGSLGTFVTAWGYNSAGMVDWMRYPQDNLGNPGELVDYTYHNQLTLNSVLSNFPEAYALNTYYDPAGRVIERKMGDLGHLTTQYQYYPWTTQGGRLQRSSSGIDNGQLDALMDMRYTYDAPGNVLTIQDYKMGSPQTQSFTYDALYRLTSAQASGGMFGNYGPESYTYDAGTGNLQTKAGVTYSYTDNDHKHAVTSRSIDGWTYQYDANGNMTYRRLLMGGQEKIYNLAYDAENHLTQISGAVPQTQTYSYNGDGAHILASNGITTTVYIGNYFEWKGTVADSIRYYYAGTARIAMRKGSQAPLFLLGDHLGSTSKVVDENGQVVPGGLRLYKAWGELRYESGILPTQYRYTGQYEQFTDSNNDLYHYGARFYDPYLNRWCQPDSIITNLYDPLAWDRYQYVQSNPIKYNDPTGHIQACSDEDEGGGCGRGANVEEIYKTFDKEHGGRWDGLFAEFYALLHEARLAISRDDPLAPEIVNATGSAYTRAVSSIPQKDFNISNLTTSFGPSSIYQIAKFLTNLAT
jgi:RHS repeat-associated protein